MLLKLLASSLQTGSSLASVSLKPPQHGYERLKKPPSLRKIEQHNAVKNDDRKCNSPSVCRFNTCETKRPMRSSSSGAREKRLEEIVAERTRIAAAQKKHDRGWGRPNMRLPRI